MSQFAIRGQYQVRGKWEPLHKEIEAENESVAREHMLALFGSKHGLKRTQVNLEEVVGQ